MLAVLLLVLVAALVWRGALEPLWRIWQEDREAVAGHRDAIARLKGLASQREALLAALEREQAGSELETTLIRADSDTLAAAELQQQVKSLVESHGGSLVSAQPTTSQAAGPFTHIGLNLRMLLTVEALQQVLHELESRRPVTVIEQMLVLSRSRARGTTRRRPAPPRSDQLDVRLTVGGFLAPGGKG